MRYWTELGRRGLDGSPEGLGRSTALAGVAADEMWARVADGDPYAREEMIHRHMRVVRGVAGNIARRLPPHVDQEDLESYGYEGLIKAVDRFDASMGVPFERFASTLVYSRIMDTLRELDWAPKALRRRARDMEKVRRTLTAQKGREPSDAEIAEKLDQSEEYVRQVRVDVRASTFKSYHEPDSPNTESGDPGLSVLADVGPLPEDSAVLSLCRQALSEWLDGLTYEEHVILALYYYEQHTLAQVAERTGRSESKVAQTHARLVLELREALVGVLTTHH